MIWFFQFTFKKGRVKIYGLPGPEPEGQGLFFEQIMRAEKFIFELNYLSEEIFSRKIGEWRLFSKKKGGDDLKKSNVGSNDLSVFIGVHFHDCA